ESFGSQFIRFRQRQVAIVNSNVSQPVGWYVPHFRSRLIHASSWTIVVSKGRVSHWPKLLHIPGPPKQGGVKLPCLIGIGSREFVPGKRVRNVIDPDSSICACLPKTKHRPSRILHYGHATHIHHIEWFFH